jgi:putative copper export protein
VTVVGAALVAASFWLTGHTVANPLRWALAPLLTFHVMIVAFWFGALVPLYITCAVETAAIAGKVTEAFSEVALWLVPGIALAGAALSIGLVHHTAELTTRYGLSLLAKFLGFVLLMGLAALNKWRLGPAIVVGDAFAIRSFRRCLAAEYVLISAVLSITAVMTTLYSPEP